MSKKKKFGEFIARKIWKEKQLVKKTRLIKNWITKKKKKFGQQTKEI